MQAQLKLSYFEDNKGRNELSRLILALGGMPYQDEAISHSEYVARRDAGRLPYGQLPTLEVDGEVHGQSCAIARYVARRTGLYPSDELEQLRTDALVDSWRDCLDLFYETVFERVVIGGKLSMFPRPQHQRAARLSTFVDTELSAHFSRFEDALSSSPLHAPQLCTSVPFPSWADLAVYDLAKTMEGVLEPPVFYHLMTGKPALTQMVARIDALEPIKAHLSKHPYKDIRSLFARVPWWKAAIERFLFPALQWAMSFDALVRALVSATRGALRLRVHVGAQKLS